MFNDPLNLIQSLTLYLRDVSHVGGYGIPAHLGFDKPSLTIYGLAAQVLRQVMTSHRTFPSMLLSLIPFGFR